VEGFVGDEDHFELDSLLDGEPVEVLKDWGGVVSGLEWVSRQAAEFWMDCNLLRVLVDVSYRMPLQ